MIVCSATGMAHLNRTEAIPTLYELFLHFDDSTARILYLIAILFNFLFFNDVYISNYTFRALYIFYILRVLQVVKVEVLNQRYICKAYPLLLISLLKNPDDD